MIITRKFLQGVCVACCFLTTPITVSASNVKLDLEKIIKIAQENNPQIDVARQQCIQGQGILIQAQSGYLPRLAVEGSLGRAHIEDLEPDDTDRLNTASVNVYQLIYDFGDTGGAIESSRMTLEASDYNLYQIAQDIAFTAKAAFYDVLAAERLVKVEEQAVSNYEKQLYRAKKYFEAGVRTKIDVTNAGVKLSTSKLNLIQAEANRKTARVRLEQVLGKQPNNGNYTLVHYDKALEQLAGSKPGLPGSIDSHLITAFENRPDFEALNLLIEAAKADIRRAKSGYFPSINARGGYDEVDSGLSTFEDQWNVGVDLTWELFSGFETEGEMIEAEGRLKEVIATRNDLLLAIRQEVTDSYLRAEENRDGVDIADETLLLATENLEMADGRYKAGLSDSVEYDDAQLDFTRAQSNLVITFYDYLTALARLKRAVGVTPELPVWEEEDREPCSY